MTARRRHIVHAMASPDVVQWDHPTWCNGLARRRAMGSPHVVMGSTQFVHAMGAPHVVMGSTQFVHAMGAPLRAELLVDFGDAPRLRKCHAAHHKDHDLRKYSPVLGYSRVLSGARGTLEYSPVLGVLSSTLRCSGYSRVLSGAGGSLDVGAVMPVAAGLPARYSRVLEGTRGYSRVRNGLYGQKETRGSLSTEQIRNGYSWVLDGHDLLPRLVLARLSRRGMGT